MTNRVRTLIAVALTLLGAQACTRLPPPGVPVSPEELSAALEGLATCEDDAPGLRGSGHGELSLPETKIPFVYAFVYSRPGWLRADVRPDGVMTPGGLTTLLLLDGSSALAFMPDRMLAASGTVDALAARVPWTDHAAVAIGASDGRFLAELERPSLSRDGDSIFVTGTYGAASVRAEIAASPPRLVNLEVRGHEGTLSVEYSGHGWKAIPWLPRTVEAEIATRGRRTFRLSLRHESARAVPAVTRTDYAFDVPDGATFVDPDNFDPWRAE